MGLWRRLRWWLIHNSPSYRCAHMDCRVLKPMLYEKAGDPILGRLAWELHKAMQEER